MDNEDNHGDLEAPERQRGGLEPTPKAKKLRTILLAFLAFHIIFSYFKISYCHFKATLIDFGALSALFIGAVQTDYYIISGYVVLNCMSILTTLLTIGTMFQQKKDISEQTNQYKLYFLGASMIIYGVGFWLVFEAYKEFKGMAYDQGQLPYQRVGARAAGGMYEDGIEMMDEEHVGIKSRRGNHPEVAGGDDRGGRGGGGLAK